MKIHAADLTRNAFKVGFKSTRTDKITAEQLKKGEKPLIENNKLNIYTALNNLSSNPNRNNIEFLIDIAANLQYGQGQRDSQFSNVLNADNLTPDKRENTDWNKLLDDTIRRAISSSDEDVKDLEIKYNQVVEENKKITPQQQDLLNLRKVFTNMILENSVLDDTESISRTARVRKNLDYFIASSEISSKQKTECLEKLIYFMSDEYKINPQLQDKKLQVVDEMLNDMIIKTPEDKKLTIKEVDQRQSGMCAAISICRKAIAYEDKTRYVELIMEELKDSPVMPVYDITELGTGKMINIEKTEVDYSSALEKGYRIIDASAHNWMHNAHASGDGSIQTEYYVPFDEETYGIFNDSSWYLGIDDKYSTEKTFLQTLIKERNFIKSFYNTKEEMENVKNSFSRIKKEVYESQKLSIGKLNSLFKDIFPEKSDAENTKTIKNLFGFYKGTNENHEANAASQLPAEIKQNVLVQYLIDNSSGITEEQKNKIKSNGSLIYSMTDEYTKAETKLKTLNRFNTPKSKYIYNKKLFNIAAAHRIAAETETELPDSNIKYENLFSLPPRDIQITDYLKSLKPKSNSLEFRKNWTDEKGNIPSKEVIDNELNSDIIKMETIIPSEINSVLETLTGEDTAKLAATMLSRISDEIQNKEYTDTSIIKERIGSNINDDNELVSELNKLSKKLTTSPNDKDVLNAVRILGYNDRIEFTSAIITTFFEMIQNGVTQELYDSFAEKFGGENRINSGLLLQQIKFQKLFKEYSQILEKWGVPEESEVILKKMENQNKVISKDDLNKLKNKFDSVAAEQLKSKQLKKPLKANNKIYEFSKEETEILDNIEKSLPFVKKYSNANYQDMNNLLYYELEKQYADIGMLNGQFWVREEGSSGLAANEQLRIIEQMTGKPYHLEQIAENAAEKIKKGEGSGIISMSVLDNDYAFHAQYVPAVTTETFTNPITKEKLIKDVLWMDNSWGDSEKEYFWNGHNGFNYTDYGSGYGWKDGFILDDDQKIGMPVENISSSYGISPDNDVFCLLTDVILSGQPDDTYNKLYKVFDHILNMNQGKKYLSQLEASVSKGNKINITELENLDIYADIKKEELENRIKNEIKTKEDFDNLPEDDEIKLIFKKIAVSLPLKNKYSTDEISLAENSEELSEITQAVKEDIVDKMKAITGKNEDIIKDISKPLTPKFKQVFNELKKKYNVSLSKEDKDNIIKEIFKNSQSSKEDYDTPDKLENYLVKNIISAGAKYIGNKKAEKYFSEKGQKLVHNYIDENIKIKSLDSPALKNSNQKDIFIAAVDKYLNPSSDDELLSLIQGLQYSDSKTADEFFNALELEDTGINIKEPYYYFKLYKADNSNVKNAFSGIINTVELTNHLDFSEEDETENADLLYRYLYVTLSNLNVQKFVKSYKAEAFQKYKVRQAFPDTVVFNNNIIESTVEEGILPTFKQYSKRIQDNKVLLNVISELNNIQNKFKSEPFYNDLINNKDVEIGLNNYQQIKEFKKELGEIYGQLVKNNINIKVNDSLELLLYTLNSSKSHINGEQAGKCINDIINKSGNYDIQKSNLMKNNIKALKEINSYTKNTIESNIEPKYRDTAYNLLNNYMNLCKKNADEEDLIKAENEIIKLFTERHIVKNPTALLEETAKMMNEGKTSTNAYKTLRGYLVSALHVAKQTELQYLLVKNQHQGISSKTKDMLKYYTVTTDKGTETMDSETGLLYIVTQLANSEDEYATLNLFLDQSGLSKRTINALINNFNIEESKTMICEQTEQIKHDIHQIEKSAEYMDNFISMSNMKYKSVKEAVENMNSYVERQFSDDKDSQVLKDLLNYTKKIVYTGNSESESNPEFLRECLSQISSYALVYLAQELNNNINALTSLNKLNYNRIVLVNSIRIPSDSDENNRRNQYNSDYNEFRNLYAQKMEELGETLKNCKFLKNGY